MPTFFEVWSTLLILNVSFLRIRFSMAWFMNMISNPAISPSLSARGMITCEITARSDTESCARHCSCWSVGYASMMRSIVRAEPVVCSVPSTRWPVSAAVIAVEIVSRSRISPSRITSGSMRSTRRMASLNVPTSEPISRCVMIDFLCWWWYSIGSSIVTTWWSNVVFT
ncbi:MAG: hypothetical protein HMLKMBBP_01754 [Planctomycetes bacterium]|nr:hypothetical protein [Planctomycetota bacterium]